MLDVPKQIQALIASVLADLQDVRVLWQIAALAMALGLAWVAQRATDRGAQKTVGPWRLAHEGARRAIFPAAALVVVLAMRAALQQWQSIHLLNVAVPLLGALLLIRIAIYLLRLVFAPAQWVTASEKAVAWTIWIGFALHITGILPDIVRVLDDVGFTMGKHRITLLLVLQASFSVAITLLIAMTIARLVEGRIMAAGGLDINVRVMAVKLARALLVLAAILVALPAVGIDLTMLSVFGGAVGVGLGFGLQKIASNYVSGFIILLDRSLSIGDMVNVDNRAGQLTRMTARYIVVRGLDGVEAIIPNESVITSTVLNLTHSDRRVRIATPVQVSYGTDLDHAIALMLAAARSHPRVLAEPAPSVLVLRLADSGIDLELGVWIGDPEAGQGNVRSDLLRAILAAFHGHHVQIPYPHREIRVVGTAPAAGPIPASP
jgi:small-conductance mechanosensitive channel